MLHNFHMLMKIRTWRKVKSFAQSSTGAFERLNTITSKGTYDSKC